MVSVFSENLDHDKFTFEDLCLTKIKEKEILDVNIENKLKFNNPIKRIHK